MTSKRCSSFTERIRSASFGWSFQWRQHSMTDAVMAPVLGEWANIQQLLVPWDTISELFILNHRWFFSLLSLPTSGCVWAEYPVYFPGFCLLRVSFYTGSMSSDWLVLQSLLSPSWQFISERPFFLLYFALLCCTDSWLISLLFALILACSPCSPFLQQTLCFLWFAVNNL